MATSVQSEDSSAEMLFSNQRSYDNYSGEYHVGPCLVLQNCNFESQGPYVWGATAPPSFVALNKEKITVGRSYGVDILLLSNAVSRLHATLTKCSNEEWNIMDNGSVNGVYINGKKIKPGKRWSLVDGNVIHFSLLPPPGVSYTFKSNGAYKRPCGSSATAPKKCKLARDETEVGAIQCTAPHNSVEVPLAPSSSSLVPVVDDDVSPEKLSLMKKNKALEDRLREMEKRFDECMKQKEEELNQKMESEQARLGKEKQELENKLRESESLLQEEWNAKLAKLLKEQKTAMEEKVMMQNMLEKLKEKTDDDGAKEQLELKLLQAELQCLALQSQLEEMKTSTSVDETVATKLRDDLMQNFSRTMETELQCSICNELFVKAMTLTCSHSFCNYCINEWKKKKAECPMCRQPIMCIAPSVVLDSFIDKVVETFTTELKERRKSLTDERRGLVVKAESVIVIPDAVIPVRGRRGRGRGQQRATRRSTARGRNAPVPVPVPAPPPTLPTVVINRIEISSESSTNDDEPSLDYSSISSDDDVIVDGAYYGGYGTCYRCGRRGHWANGCPY